MKKTLTRQYIADIVDRKDWCDLVSIEDTIQIHDDTFTNVSKIEEEYDYIGRDLFIDCYCCRNNITD